MDLGNFLTQSAFVVGKNASDKMSVKYRRDSPCSGVGWWLRGNVGALAGIFEFLFKSHVWMLFKRKSVFRKVRNKQFPLSDWRGMVALKIVNI